MILVLGSTVYRYLTVQLIHESTDQLYGGTVSFSEVLY